MSDKKNYYHLWLGLDPRLVKPNLFQIMGVDPRSEDDAAIKAKASRTARMLFAKLEEVVPKTIAETSRKQKLHEKIVLAYDTVSSKQKRTQYLRTHAEKAEKAGLLKRGASNKLASPGSLPKNTTTEGAAKSPRPAGSGPSPARATPAASRPVAPQGSVPAGVESAAPPPLPSSLASTPPTSQAASPSQSSVPQTAAPVNIPTAIPMALPVSTSPQYSQPTYTADPGNGHPANVEHVERAASFSVRPVRRRKRSMIFPALTMLFLITCVGGLVALLINYGDRFADEIAAIGNERGAENPVAESAESEKTTPKSLPSMTINPEEGNDWGSDSQGQGVAEQVAEPADALANDTVEPTSGEAEVVTAKDVETIPKFEVPEGNPSKDFDSVTDLADGQAGDSDNVSMPKSRDATDVAMSDKNNRFDGSESAFGGESASSLDLPEKSDDPISDEGNPFGVGDDPFGLSEEMAENSGGGSESSQGGDVTIVVEVIEVKPDLETQLAVRDALAGDRNPGQTPTNGLDPVQRTISLTDGQLTAIRLAHYRSTDALLRNDTEMALFFNTEAIKVLSQVNVADPEDVSPKQRPLISVVKETAQMIAWVENFWLQVRLSAVQMGGGTEVVVGEKIMALVEGRPEDVILRIAGRNVTFKYRNLTPVLAMTIGDLGSKKNVPKWNLSKTAFAAVMEEQYSGLRAKRDGFLRQLLVDGYDLERDVVEGYAQENWGRLGLPARKISVPDVAECERLMQPARKSFGYPRPELARQEKIPEFIHRLVIYPREDLKLRVACLLEAVALIEKSGRVNDLGFVNRELAASCSDMDFDRSFVEPVLAIAAKTKSQKRQNEVAREIVIFVKRFDGNPNFGPKARGRLIKLLATIAENLNDPQLAAMAARFASEAQ